MTKNRWILIAVTLMIAVSLSAQFSGGQGNFGQMAKRQAQQKAAEAEKNYQKGNEYLEAKKYDKAFAAYEKAANDGHAGAQYKLATFYIEGKQVPQDIHKALEWFEKAANQGMKDAQYKLAAIYYQGAGIPKDEQKAEYWAKVYKDKIQLDPQIERTNNTTAQNRVLANSSGMGKKEKAKKITKQDNNLKEETERISQTVEKENVTETLENGDVSLFVASDGNTKEEATKYALRSAIEQAYGVFVSSNTTILNDVLMNDEIATITSGYIKKYQYVSEKNINGKYYVSLQVVVSTRKLVNYVISKGGKAELDGATFAANIRMQQMNKKNASIAIQNLDRQLMEILPYIYDYDLQVSEIKEKEFHGYNGNRAYAIHQRYTTEGVNAYYCCDIKIDVKANNNINSFNDIYGQILDIRNKIGVYYKGHHLIYPLLKSILSHFAIKDDLGVYTIEERETAPGPDYDNNPITPATLEDIKKYGLLEEFSINRFMLNYPYMLPYLSSYPDNYQIPKCECGLEHKWYSGHPRLVAPPKSYGGDRGAPFLEKSTPFFTYAGSKDHVNLWIQYGNTEGTLITTIRAQLVYNLNEIGKITSIQLIRK